MIRGCNIDFDANYTVDCSLSKNLGLRSSSNSDDDDDGLSTGAIVGITIACVVVGVSVIFIVAWKFCLEPRTVEKAQKSPVQM